jgi:hypothetical protein
MLTGYDQWAFGLSSSISIRGCSRYTTWTITSRYLILPPAKSVCPPSCAIRIYTCKLTGFISSVSQTWPKCRSWFLTSKKTLDNEETMVVWIGVNASPQLLSDLFGVDEIFKIGPHLVSAIHLYLQGEFTCLLMLKEPVAGIANAALHPSTEYID